MILHSSSIFMPSSCSEKGKENMEEQRVDDYLVYAINSFGIGCHWPNSLQIIKKDFPDFLMNMSFLSKTLNFDRIKDAINLNFQKIIDFSDCVQMNEKSVSKTFDIKDLYSSTDNFQDRSCGKKSSPLDEISRELELSEFYQNKRLSENLQKRLFYQNQIDELKRKLKEKDSPAKDAILQLKDELQNSQNLSKSLNQLLQSEYALKSRISGIEKNLDSRGRSQESLEKKSVLRGNADLLCDSKGRDQEISDKLKENQHYEGKSDLKEESPENFEKRRILKGNQENEDDKPKFWKRVNNEETENLEVLRPVNQDPFRKVFEKKDANKEKRENSLKKEEKKQLYKRYVQLLKKKKNLMESQGGGLKIVSRLYFILFHR